MSRAPGGTSRFAYDPPIVHHGEGCVASLDDELARHDVERVLVVCGRSVGANRELVEAVRDALGERLAGVYAETTPAKRLSTAVRASERLDALDADALVGLGGGSSLDVATVASLVTVATGGPDPRTPAALGAELVETGTIAVPDGTRSRLPPVVTVPTTLAGAALSGSAGVTVHPDGGLVDAAADGGVSHPALTPLATVSDPDLVATTPPGALRGSAMNGIDKAVETLYARTASPVTDAAAERALALYREGVPRIAGGELDAAAVAPAVEATLLAQYGVSRADASTLSVIHAFGHGLSRTTPLQQGVAHAVVAPQVLRAIFDAVDGRRERLAAALGVPRDTDPAAGAVDAVAGFVDTLGLPNRLRDVDGPAWEDLEDVARVVHDDPLMAYRPDGYDPSVAALAEILEDAW